MSKRPTIALCMIVKNEENHIARLFETFKGCFDEVHVTDTGSTDKTVEILNSLGANVHHFEWVNDFAAARNYSFSHAKTDFIMWLDADDALMNREAFISFRDNVMDLADYWIAKYDYSSDTNGKPICSFARERVIRRSKQMNWRYPIHEGVTPQSPLGEVRVNYIPTWHVKHMRTNEDIEKDRSRNLGIFETLKDKGMDARMRYYFGKELFEANKPVEAANELLKVIDDKTMEHHDRILAYQYLCYSYMSCNQFERTIEIAHKGLVVDPHRAELYCVLGDAYLKMNKFVDAIPAYSAAKSCLNRTPQNYASTVFHHEDSYGLYPHNQLARIYANMGDLDRAYLESKDCFEKHKSDETKSIQAEIVRIKGVVASYKNAKPCDDIVISCPPGGAYLWDGDIYKQKSMGGSETAAIEMAQWLHKLTGRNVLVFNPRETELTTEGVKYIPTTKIADYMGTNKPWLHIAWRHNMKITDATTYVWCHDLFIPGMENHANYEKLMALTPFHKRYLVSAHGVPADKIYVTRNGINPERFIEKSTKNPNKFVFPNSPDRGLDRVMRVLDRVRETHPDVELHVFYGIEHLPKWGKQQLHDTLKTMIAERPWVKYHGATQQDEMMKHFRDAAVWLYPSDFIETSCISAMELVGNGVYPIARKLGGIVDTLADAESKGMATLIESDCITESEYQLYIDATKKALDEKAWERVQLDMNELSWERVAQSWLNEIAPKQIGALAG